MPLRYWYILLCFFVISCKNNREQDLRITPELSAALDSAGLRADNGDPKGAVIWLNQLYSRSKPTILDNYRRFFQINNIFYRSNNPVMALQYADSMARLLESAGLTQTRYQDYSKSYFSAGDALFAMGQYVEGARSYNEGRIIGLRHNDNCILSAYDYRLGMVLYRQERYVEAAGHFQKAIKQNEVCADNDFRIASYVQQLHNNAALCWLKAGQPDSALTGFLKARRIIDSFRLQYPGRSKYWNDAEAVVLGNMGEALAAKGLYDSAARTYSQALAYPDYERDIPDDAARTRIKVAVLLLQINKPDSAARILQDLEPVVNSLDDNSVRELWLHSRVRLYQAKENWKAALESLIAADSISVEESDLKRQYEMQDLNDKVLELDQSRRYGIMLESQRNKDRLIVAVVICSLILAICVVVVLVNYRKSKLFIGRLSGLNSTIRRQKTDLETALKEIQRNHQDKDQIMRMVAHDLRSPVASIYWMANVMLEENDLSAEQRENLSLIKLASSNSLSLSKDILEAVTMLGNTELNKSRIVLNELVIQQAQLIRGDAGTKDIKLLTVLPDEPVTMLADGEQLGRVLNNLIFNAIKFSPEGSTITVSMKKEVGNVVISIEDEGIGIPLEIQDRVFDAFTESKRTGTKGEKSYGLGLSISRRITELHNGTIRFESQPGKRTVFHITLPLQT